MFIFEALARYDETALGEAWLTRQPNFNMARLDPFLATNSKLQPNQNKSYPNELILSVRANLRQLGAPSLD
jgi:hypothetical protein